MGGSGPTDWRRVSEQIQRKKQEGDLRREEEDREFLTKSREVHDVLVSMGIKYYGLPWDREGLSEEDLEEKRIENFEDCFAEYHPYIEDLKSARDSGVFTEFWIDTDIGTKSCSSTTLIAGKDTYGNKINILTCRDGEVTLGE